jgi:hypothetical protein
MGSLDNTSMNRVNDALSISFGLMWCYFNVSSIIKFCFAKLRNAVGGVPYTGLF